MPAASVPTRRQLYIPLTIAAAIVYRAFLDAREQAPQTEEELEKRIDQSARSVSIALRVYRLDLADPMEIPAATLAEGSFINGGRSLQFRDGRPPIESLGVNRVDLDDALWRCADLLPESRPETVVPGNAAARRFSVARLTPSS